MEDVVQPFGERLFRSSIGPQGKDAAGFQVLFEFVQSFGGVKMRVGLVQDVRWRVVNIKQNGVMQPGGIGGIKVP